MTTIFKAGTQKRKWLKRILIGIAILILIPLISIWVVSESLPKGVESPQADALARKMMKAVHHDAWLETAVVSWNFMGIHQHLWDKERNYSRVKWDNKEVFVRLDTQDGLAFEDGQAVSGKAADKLVQAAWAHHCNDAFWLNPIAKLFDPGTSRKLVDIKDGSTALLITYGSGGVTPGDSYLWFPDEGGLPEKWKMWVNIIPVGGVSTSWEGWQQLPTGAKISTRHKGPFGLELVLSDIKADTNAMSFFGGDDPFKVLE